MQEGKIAEYRAAAANCLKWAEREANKGTSLRWRKMAEQWTKLAENLERKFENLDPGRD